MSGGVSESAIGHSFPLTEIQQLVYKGASHGFPVYTLVLDFGIKQRSALCGPFFISAQFYERFKERVS
jgi:hypothetical protein